MTCTSQGTGRRLLEVPRDTLAPIREPDTLPCQLTLAAPEAGGRSFHCSEQTLTPHGGEGSGELSTELVPARRKLLQSSNVILAVNVTFPSINTSPQSQTSANAFNQAMVSDPSSVLGGFEQVPPLGFSECPCPVTGHSLGFCPWMTVCRNWCPNCGSLQMYTAIIESVGSEAAILIQGWGNVGVASVALTYVSQLDSGFVATPPPPALASPAGGSGSVGKFVGIAVAAVLGCTALAGGALSALFFPLSHRGCSKERVEGGGCYAVKPIPPKTVRWADRIILLVFVASWMSCPAPTIAPLLIAAAGHFGVQADPIPIAGIAIVLHKFGFAAAYAAAKSACQTALVSLRRNPTSTMRLGLCFIQQSLLLKGWPLKRASWRVCVQERCLSA